jgi:hypothetical protein
MAHISRDVRPAFLEGFVECLNCDPEGQCTTAGDQIKYQRIANSGAQSERIEQPPLFCSSAKKEEVVETYFARHSYSTNDVYETLWACWMGREGVKEITKRKLYLL